MAASVLTANLPAKWHMRARLATSPRAFGRAVMQTGRRTIAWAAEAEGVEAGGGNSTSRFSLTLKKPMGMVLGESDKGIVVEEVTSGGNADKAGVQVGDVIAECSCVTLKAGKEGQFEKEGYGRRPYDNWQKIMFKCEGQDFDDVMKAIASNNPRWGYNSVDLIIKRSDAP